MRAVLSSLVPSVFSLASPVLLFAMVTLAVACGGAEGGLDAEDAEVLPPVGCTSSAACEDHDPCNGVEACVEGACVAGEPVACEGGQTCRSTGECACPTGTWNNAGTCQPVLCDEHADCDDGDPCNGVETCGAELTCQGGEPVACGAHAACREGTCACDPGFHGDPDVGGGGCVANACEVDADCRDDDACNGLEACVDFACQAGLPVTCGLHAACQVGACACDPGFHGDPDAACLADECGDHADCDDGQPCNGVEACVEHECQAGVPVACGGGRVCDGFGDCACPAGTVGAAGGDCAPPAEPLLSGFEAVPLDGQGVWNGVDGSGGVADGPCFFGNSYSAEYASWEGFAVSSHTDTTTPGWGNQYSAVPGAGAGGSAAYAVAFAGFAGPPTLTFPGAPDGVLVESIQVTNTTYTFLSLRDGDAFAKKFGGAEGTDPDWFKLTFTGHDGTGAAVGSVDVYLADFRADDAADDTLVDQWLRVDLAGLGPVSSLTLSFASSDVGAWGMNTPAYAALDDVTVRPLDASVAAFEQAALDTTGVWNGADGSGGVAAGDAWFGNAYDAAWGSFEGFALSNQTDTATPGWANQYSAIAGEGAEGSAVYAVSYGSAASFSGFQPYVSFPEAGDGVWVDGAFVTNTTYVFFSMLNGDDYAKKFGGADGTDPDWFKLSVTGLTAAGAISGPVELYLADFRAAEASGDTLTDDWTWLDLRPLGQVRALLFDLTSSDTGDWGMNTPAYFALDGLRTRTAR